MSIRSESIRRKSASAAAALVVSAFFITAAVGPAISVPSTQTASIHSSVRAA